MEKQRLNTEPEQAENPQNRVGNTAFYHFKFYVMKFRMFSIALTALALCIATFSCTQKEDIQTDPIVDTSSPDIPDGNRIYINFGTSTYRGCMYSFSNCIWIGWDATATNFEDHLALQFGNGSEAGQYFGQYFPLTSDYVVDAATAKELGIQEGIIPAGFYVMRDAANGLPTGKRIVSFRPEDARPVAGLVNPNNPQDNIGQLHNLAVQVVLNDNRDAINALEGNNKAIQKLLTEKTAQFLAEAELPVNDADRKRADALNLDRDFSNYAARLDETRLSANDKKILLSVFDEAASIPVGSPEELSHFVNIVTERENQLARVAKLDNPKVVLSMVSVLKYSRYFWYWKSISSQEPGTGGAQPSKIPDWVWADAIALELGGPIASAIASTAVYLDQR